MSCQDFFDFGPDENSRDEHVDEHVDEQQKNLERVRSRTALAIIRFLREHRRFHADALHDYVLRQTGVAAPASSDRILRDLRQRKLIDYKVVNRRESLYQVLWIAGDKEA